MLKIVFLVNFNFVIIMVRIIGNVALNPLRRNYLKIGN